MKMLFLSFWLLLGCFGTKGITSDSDLYQIVRMPHYYNELGVIFYKEFSIPISIKNLKERYTPSIKEVEGAEIVLIEKYNLVRPNQMNVKRYLRNNVRHYVGFIDNNGKKNIVIQLVNNENKRKVRNLLGKGWETDFQVTLSDKFYAIAQLFKVNIDTGEISTQF